MKDSEYEKLLPNNMVLHVIGKGMTKDEILISHQGFQGLRLGQLDFASLEDEWNVSHVQLAHPWYLHPNQQ